MSERERLGLHDALVRFQDRWRLLPAAARAEALLPVLDLLVEVQSGVLKQAAKIHGERFPARVPFMASQFTRCAEVYAAFLDLVIALAESADAEAHDADADDAITQH